MGQGPSPAPRREKAIYLCPLSGDGLQVSLLCSPSATEAFWGHYGVGMGDLWTAPFKSILR